MVKTRMQLVSEAGARRLTAFEVARNLFKQEGGLKVFYKG
jgi:hypothetical protein